MIDPRPRDVLAERLGPGPFMPSRWRTQPVEV